MKFAGFVCIGDKIKETSAKQLRSFKKKELLWFI